MKKKLLSALIVAAAALAGWHYYTQNDEIQLSDLALENVEALAQGEDDRYKQKIWIVYKTSTGHSCTSGGTNSCL